MIHTHIVYRIVVGVDFPFAINKYKTIFPKLMVKMSVEVAEQFVQHFECGKQPNHVPCHWGFPCEYGQNAILAKCLYRLQTNRNFVNSCASVSLILYYVFVSHAATYPCRIHTSTKTTPFHIDYCFCCWTITVENSLFSVTTITKCSSF